MFCLQLSFFMSPLILQWVNGLLCRFCTNIVDKKVTKKTGELQSRDISMATNFVATCWHFCLSCLCWHFTTVGKSQNLYPYKKNPNEPCTSFKNFVNFSAVNHWDVVSLKGVGGCTHAKIRTFSFFFTRVYRLIFIKYSANVQRLLSFIAVYSHYDGSCWRKLTHSIFILCAGIPQWLGRSQHGWETFTPDEPSTGWSWLTLSDLCLPFYIYTFHQVPAAPESCAFCFVSYLC